MPRWLPDAKIFQKPNKSSVWQTNFYYFRESQTILKKISRRRFKKFLKQSLSNPLENFWVHSKIFNFFRLSFLALAVVYFFSFSSNDVKISPSVVVAYDSVISDLQIQIKELESKLKECEKINNLKTDGTYSKYVKLTTKSYVSTTISTLPITKSDDREKLAEEDNEAGSIAERYQTAKKILIENWKEPLRPG